MTERTRYTECGAAAEQKKNSSEEELCAVTVRGEKRYVPAGTSFRELAEQLQEHYPHRILLVKCNGRLRELTKTVQESCTVEMVTAAEKPGSQTYERSAVLLMLKGFYDVVGRKKIRRLIVDYSVGRALFCRVSGDLTLDQALIDKVSEAMRCLSEAALPIEKKNIHRAEAIRLFRMSGMHDKERLFRFRRSSGVNLYTLGGFSDYFYGYMVPDTSYVKLFALELFQDGFVLRLPPMETPETLGSFRPSLKVFREMHRTTEKLEKIGLDMVASLNETIAAGETKELILCEEALMEKRIGDIAQQISEKKNVRFIMIAGPSSSGKTTFSKRLSTQLRALGLRPHAIEVDNYFKNRSDTPRDENGQLDFELLQAIDIQKFNEDMMRLISGETVELPRFNFIKGEREYHGDLLTCGAEDILVIEGIHCLNDALSAAIPAEQKFRIYISCLTQMNIDEHNRIPTTDARLLRRMTRDARVRGTSAQDTIRRWSSVVRGEHRNIFPFQDSADVVFNSALIYETAVVKPYAEALLFGIPENAPEYVEAKRLLKFLDYFLTVPADNIPATSIVREFIGGGCYRV